MTHEMIHMTVLYSTDTAANHDWKWKISASMALRHSFSPFPPSSPSTCPPFQLYPFPVSGSTPQIQSGGLSTDKLLQWIQAEPADKQYLVHSELKPYSLLRKSAMHCDLYWPCDTLVWYFSEKKCVVWFWAGHGSAGMAYCPITSHFQTCREQKFSDHCCKEVYDSKTVNAMRQKKVLLEWHDGPLVNILADGHGCTQCRANYQQ